MTVFATVDALKDAVLTHTAEDFFDQFLLGQGTPHFDDDKLGFVSEVLQEEYGVAPHKDEMVVVGSSKLGFALHDKWKDGAVTAPAFRSFGVDSDIDLTICSHELFDILWHELSAFLCRKDYLPVRYKKLGDYMSYGWLRTDQIPYAPAPHLVKCDNLRFACAKVRKNRQRGHPKVNFGIFHDVEHLKLYQTRSIDLCRLALENPL